MDSFYATNSNYSLRDLNTTRFNYPLLDWMLLDVSTKMDHFPTYVKFIGLISFKSHFSMFSLVYTSKEPEDRTYIELEQVGERKE